MRVLALVCFLLCRLVADEVVLPPQFFHIPHKVENSVLSMDCEFPVYEDKDNINCKFTQLNIRYPEVDTAKELFKMDSSLAKRPNPEVANDIRIICSTFSANTNWRRPGLSKERFNQDLNALCKEKRSKETFKKIGRLFAKSTAETCKLWNYSFDLSFKRMGKYKWVSDSSPKGICNVSTVATLESKNGSLWKYTQIRNGVGDAENELCKPMQESVGKPITYSWEYDGQFDLMGCTTVEFGF